MRSFFICTLFMLIGIANSFALTLQAYSKYDTFYGYFNDYNNQPIIYINFGKMYFPSEYGIFLNATYRSVHDNGNKASETSFYRIPNASFEKEGKILYLNIQNQSIPVAVKKFLRWKLLPEVKLKHEVIYGSGNFNVSVKLILNEKNNDKQKEKCLCDPWSGACC